MSIELPVLRVGLAGFSAEQQDQLSALLELASSVSWQVARLAEADVWCVNGARVRVLRDSTISVDCVEPAGRSLQLDLREVDRPVAFAVPLPRDFKPLYTFEPGSASSVGSILQKFEAWMRPLLAQFCLASCILEQESVLGPGIHHVSAEGVLIAVVNMRGETGVLPTAGPFEFENAMWERLPATAGAIPEHFVRSSLSQLMWQFATRTRRDVLPARYRTGLLFFRRPPRLPPRLMRDSHLLLLRELACAPGDFDALQQRTGLEGHALARDLAALYYVGAITSNPKRAALLPVRAAADPAAAQQHSGLPSGMGREAAAKVPRNPRALLDATAPAPL
ncbi:MAG TPA: hypothetical protein VNN06_00440 [Ramlibacter sp.]|nr:hypothetical protein [Ramlibacter sp.]